MCKRTVSEAPAGIDALLIKVARKDKVALKVIYQLAGPWLHTMIRASEDNEDIADSILEGTFPVHLAPGSVIQSAPRIGRQMVESAPGKADV